MLGIMLDGVLVQDQPITEGRFDLRPHLKPMFTPRGEYALIVDRNPLCIEQTSAWVVKHLPIVPTHIYYADGHNTDVRAKANFRIRACLELGITKFVDADYECLLHVKQELGNKVACIHFSSFVFDALVKDSIKYAL